MAAPDGGAEDRRLAEDSQRQVNWKRWGPYLAERQWGTVREDYSASGEVWDYFPHDHARSRAYRWGEDGLLGICDREGRLGLAVALWNGRDPFLKERLFGLTGPEGNHGEDVKEVYFYLDSTPTHSYLKALYKYPQAEFPYARLLDENRRRGRQATELELADTGVFGEDRYFDVTAEYAKAGPDDVLVRLVVENRGPERAPLDVLPTLWFRNTWAWGRRGESYWREPEIRRQRNMLVTQHETLGSFRLAIGPGEDGRVPPMLFTDNETNVERLFGGTNPRRHVKDAFHEHVVHGRRGVLNPEEVGTKAAAHYRFTLEPGERREIRLRLAPSEQSVVDPLGSGFDTVLAMRIAEADAFHDSRMPAGLDADARAVVRQARAGLLWSKQFYHYIVKDWIDGDPGQPPPPEQRRRGRNADWAHLYNRDVISMPDKWEYPWYAAWDLAFQAIPLAELDTQFAKDQLLLLLREWYMHPSGQVPAYEFAFGDVNPPVHAWACWRVYKMTGPRGERDRLFLARAFHKLLLNFTWWVNRKDLDGRNIFSGGFLGLDNIGVFDRSKPLARGGRLEQADGTAWMACFCLTMLQMALELATQDPAYEDVASKFFEHFVAITDAMNNLGGTGLWDEDDGFYYDALHVDGHDVPLRVRSLVGLVPLFAVEILDEELIEQLPGFRKRLHWFLDNRKDLARHIASLDSTEDGRARRLLAVAGRRRLERVLSRVLDENEFLSPHGIRSLSRAHRDAPFVLRDGGEEWRVDYAPGESQTGMFGGNSNWRGPVWFPMNYLLIEALERYEHFYGDSLQVECPTGSGRLMDLKQVAREISRRLCSLFLPDASGRRPCHADDPRFAGDGPWRDLLLFHEFFDGDTGRGLGASHQTGWTALVTRCFQDVSVEPPAPSAS